TRVWDHQGGPDRLARLYPLARVGEPEDVAAAVAFLASADGAWITGHTLPVDGRLSIRGVPEIGRRRRRRRRRPCRGDRTPAQDANTRAPFSGPVRPPTRPHRG